MAQNLLSLFVEVALKGEKQVFAGLKALEVQGQKTEDRLNDIAGGMAGEAKKAEAASGRIQKTLGALERKSKDLNNQRVSLRMDLKGAGEVTSGLEAIKNRRDSLDRGKITLSTTLRGASAVIGELGTLEGVSSRIDGDKVLLTADVDGTEQGIAGLLSLQSVASRIDGDNLRMKVDVDGAPQAIAELAAINQVANRVDGRNVNLKTNSGVSALEALGSSIDKVATRMRSLQQVGSVAVIPGLVAAVGALPAIITPALAALYALAGAMGAGLAGAASVGGGALTAFAGSIGLIAAPIMMLLSKLGDYDDSLDKIASKQKTAASAADSLADAERGAAQAAQGVADARQGAAEGVAAAEKTYQDALRGVQDAARGVKDAERGLHDAKASAAEGVADAEESYRDALRGVEDAARAVKDAERGVHEAKAEAAQGVADAEADYQDALQGVADAARDVKDAERGLHEAQREAAQGVADAQDEYRDALRGVEDAEDDLSGARGELRSATQDLEAAQNDLNDALREEPLNQQEATLDLADARDRASDAQRDYNEAVREHGRNSEEATDAARSLERAQLNLQKTENDVRETRREGSSELQSAQEDVKSASEQERNARQGVADAEQGLNDARREASEAYQGIAAAEREGAQGIAEAQRGLADAQRAYSAAQNDAVEAERKIGAARREGATGVADAQRTAADAQRGLVDAQRDALSAQQDIDKARREGAKQVADAQRTVADSQRALIDSQRDAREAEAGIAKARQDGAKQVAAALRSQEDAQRAVAKAAEALAEADKGLLDEIVPLTAAQMALYNAFQRFKGIALAAFTPAIDQAARLGIQILRLATTAMPSLGRASLATMNALTRVFGTFRAEISKPVEQSSLNQFLRTIPSFTEVAGNAFVKFSLAMINFFARTLPYVMQWVRSLDQGAQSFLNFTRSASGMAAIDRFLAYTTQKAVELWQATKNLAVGFFGLYSAMDQAGMVNQVWGGFLRLTEQFRQLTARGTESRAMVVDFFTASKPVLTALWSLVGSLVNQWFRVANAVMTMRNESGKLVLPQVLKDMESALVVIGDLLIAAFRNFGPYLGPIIQGLAEFAKYFIALNPVTLALTRSFAWLLEKFSGLDRNTKIMIAGLISARLAFAIMGSVIMALFSPFTRLFALIATGSPALKGLGIVMGGISAPIVITVAAIAALAAGFIYAYRNSEKFRNAVKTVGRVLNNLKTVIGGLITGNSGTNAFRQAFASLPGPVQNAIKRIVVAWRQLKIAFSQVRAAVMPILKQIGNAIKTGLVAAFKFLLRQGRQLVSWFKANWPQIKGAIVPVLRFIGRIIRTVLVAAFRFALQNARLVVNWFKQNWPLIKQTAQVVGRALVKIIQGSFNRIKAIIWPIVKQIVGFWRRNWGTIKAVLQSVWNIIKSVIRTAIRNVLNIIKLAMQIITGDWRGAWQTIKNIARDNWNNIKTIIKAALKIVWNIVKIAMNNIRGIWEAALRKIRQWAEGWGRKIRDIFQGLANFARGLWRRAWDGIRGIWESGTRRVREWVSGWRDNLKSIMGDLRDAIWGAMKSIGKALWKPIQDGWSKAKEIWNSIIDAIAGVADKFGLDSITKSLKGAKFGGGGGNAPASPAQERAKGGIDYAAKGGDFRRPRQPKLIEYGEGPADEAAIFVSKDRRHRRDNEKYTGVAANMLGGRFIPEGQLREPSRYGEAFARGGLYKGKSDRAEMRRSGGYAEDHPTHYNIRSGVKSRVDEVNANTGGDYWNTYYGHPGGDANSVDWWGGGGRGAPVGTSTGTGIANYITDKLWKGLNWIIWNHQINSGGGWAPHTGPFDHTDHVHATWQDNGGGFGGSMGGASGGGGVLGAITNPVATFWDKTIQPMADKFTGALGEGNIMNQVLAGAGKDLVGGLREKIVGSGGSGGVGGPISGSQAEVAKQFAAGAEGRGIPGPLPVMTALVESGMKNLNYGDRDSVGYFQQRPSQGWGTPEQLQDPAYALDAFLDVAEQYKGQYGNDASSLGAWAQAVQRSAFPDRYAQEYGRAKELIGYDTGGLVKKEHQAILHPNELALPLNHPRTAPLLQSMAGTDRLEKELQETRRVLNETLVRQESQMVKVKEWARAQEAATRRAIGSGRADSELGNYMLKALD